QLVRDGRVTLTVFSDPLDMNEVAVANEKAIVEFLSHANRPIHAIIDCTSVHKLPANILSQSTRMAKGLHPMSGEMIIVVRNAYITRIAQMLSKVISTHRVSVYPTMSDAWVYVDQVIAKENARP